MNIGIKRNYDWRKLALFLKLMAITIILFALQEGFFTQITTLSRSENPSRNLAIFFLVWLFSIIGVIFPAFSRYKIVRIFWGFVFSVSIFAYLAFVNIMGYTPTLADAKLLWVEADQAEAALAFYWSDLIFPLLISLMFFIIFSLSIKPIKIFHGKLLNLAGSIFPIVPMVMLAGAMILKGGGATVGMPEGLFGLGAYTTTLTYESVTQVEQPRKAIKFSKASEKLIDNIILIVDESISEDFISLDPENTITPILAENSKNIIDFGQTSSGHNCSSFSNAILRWGINSRDLSNAEIQPTIWQYAQNAGYQTIYIDAQKQPGTLGNFMDLREIKYIDKIIQFRSPQIERDMEYISNDFKAAQKIAEIVKANDQNFIYLNKLGAHFPYEGKYPLNSAIFKPHMNLFEPIGKVDRINLLNSYRNLIHWNLQNFFDIIFNEVNLERSLIIYTSDHGQNLLDQGVPTHCNRNTVSPYQALVPLLVITKNYELKKMFLSAAKINKNKASHFNIFPTLLILMGYPSDLVEREYETSLFSSINRLGKFSTGDLLSNKKEERNFNWLEIPSDLRSRLNDYLEESYIEYDTQLNIK